MTQERKKQIRESALEARGGLKSVRELPDMQHEQVKHLIEALLILTDAIIELTDEKA